MRLLEAELDTRGVFVILEEFSDTGLRGCTMEDVSGRTSVFITDTTQSLHVELEETPLTAPNLVELLYEPLLPSSTGASHKYDHSDCIIPHLPLPCRMSYSPRRCSLLPSGCLYFSVNSTLVKCCSSSILSIFFLIRFWKSFIRGKVPHRGLWDVGSANTTKTAPSWPYQEYCERDPEGVCGRRCWYRQSPVAESGKDRHFCHRVAVLNGRSSTVHKFLRLVEDVLLRQPAKLLRTVGTNRTHPYIIT